MGLKARLTALFSFGGKVGKFFLVEKALGVLTRGVDVVMIYFIWTDPVFGPLKAFLIGTPINIALCAGIVYLNNFLAQKGIDATGLEELRAVATTQHGPKQYIKRLVGWVLRRKWAIFWVGSWFYLDPDYVTILLQKKGERFIVTFRRITLPSVLIAMAVWTAIYWAALKGYTFAVWLAT